MTIKSGQHETYEGSNNVRLSLNNNNKSIPSNEQRAGLPTVPDTHHYTYYTEAGHGDAVLPNNYNNGWMLPHTREGSHFEQQ